MYLRGRNNQYQTLVVTLCLTGQIDSLNYQELRNAFNSLVIQYRKTDEKLTEIKSILEVENEG